MATVTAMPRAIGDGENLLAEEREKRGQEEEEEDWLRITLSSFSQPPDLWVFPQELLHGSSWIGDKGRRRRRRRIGPWRPAARRDSEEKRRGIEEGEGERPLLPGTSP